MPQTVQNRSQLIELLSMAAGIEHSLVAQYLYAALSMKASVEEGLTEGQLVDVAQWERMILMVARQEMEHLGLVCNLLTSIGGAPAFRIPSFPYETPLLPHSMELLPFSESTLKRFVCFEAPDDQRPSYCQTTPTPVPGPFQFHTVQDLYALIRQGFQTLGAQPGLFLVDSASQLDGSQIGTDFPHLGSSGGAYDVFLFTVQDLDSALRAIDLIVEQGEGATTHQQDPGNPSHFEVFTTMLADLQGRTDGLAPARAVVSNPCLYAREGATVLTDSGARLVAQLFQDAYNTMLFMLVRLFAHVNESEEELTELRNAAFFPFMTMVIRPMSEILTALPSGVAGLNAGPVFEVDPGLDFLPHRTAAWVMLSERIHQHAQDASVCAGHYGSDGPGPRLTYIAESLALMAQRFDSSMGVS